MNIEIFHPASTSDPKILEKNLDDLLKAGFNCAVIDKSQPEISWPYTAQSILKRSKALERALYGDADILIAARGGYGASDLLDQLEWVKLKTLKPKIIIGFSDICALLLPIHQMLGWPTLHAPMPGSALWNGANHDIKCLIGLLKKPLGQWVGEIACEPVVEKPEKIRGKLYGGCFSVLTNLIGTPYFRKISEDHILFVEDIDETPPRIIRMWNQWKHCGYTEYTKGLVIGNLRNLQSEKLVLLRELQSRTSIPVFSSEDFGHISLNTPLLLGACASIEDGVLRWKYSESNDKKV